jgi:hypothetical protein
MTTVWTVYTKVVVGKSSHAVWAVDLPRYWVKSIKRGYPNIFAGFLLPVRTPPRRLYQGSVLFSKGGCILGLHQGAAYCYTRQDWKKLVSKEDDVARIQETLAPGLGSCSGCSQRVAVCALGVGLTHDAASAVMPLQIQSQNTLRMNISKHCELVRRCQTSRRGDAASLHKGCMP